MSFATEDRKHAQERATQALAFYDSMRRYARAMLVLAGLTFLTSLFSLVRSIVHDARLDRIEKRLDALETHEATHTRLTRHRRTWLLAQR